MALVLITAIFIALGWGYLLLFIAILFAIVMLHEFGHFITAKRAGMKVTEYFVGFGPRLWSVRRGEPEYGVKAIPAGGYVRIVGFTSTEEVPEGGPMTRLPPATRFSPAHHRGVGRLGHALPHRPRPGSHPGLRPSRRSTNNYKVASLEPLGRGGRQQAALAGLRVGDTIVSIDGKSLRQPHLA